MKEIAFLIYIITLLISVYSLFTLKKSKEYNQRLLLVIIFFCILSFVFAFINLNVLSGVLWITATIFWIMNYKNL